MTKLKVVDGNVVPGVYDGIHNNEYHRSPGISNSKLKMFAESPHLYYHYHVAKDFKEELAVQSMELGDYFHALVLEKDKAGHMICKNRVGTISGDEQRREARNKGLYPVLQSQYDDAQRMRDGVYRNKMADVIFSQGKAEQSIYGVHEETGLNIRARPDWRDPKRGLVADIKTTKSIDNRNPYKLPKDILNYRWHVQEAMYTDLERQHGNEVNYFIWVVVQNCEPYTCVIAPLAPRARELGVETYNSNMRHMKECIDSEYWPIYDYPQDFGNDIENGFDLPYYAYPKEDL